jgi:cytochrome c-type biogenesis protein CcmH
LSAIPIIVFVLIALLAVGFAIWPLLRLKTKGKALLLAAIAVFMLGIGGGAYFMLGRPHLAQRQAEGLNTREVNGLIPMLIARVRKEPNDVTAWRYLAQAYMTAKDPRDAAKALAKVIALTGKGDAQLDSAYAMALAQDANAVTPEAEDAFNDALKADPHNVPARFYLGMAKMARNDRAGAAQYWNSLLAETPTASPLHQILVDRLAALTAQGNGMPAGGPRAMVAMLAARLKDNPNDALGWVRLIHAYTVLGEMDQARAALATAHKSFAGNKDAQTAFDTIAKDIK